MATREQLSATMARADAVLRRKIAHEEAELDRADAEREIEEIERARAELFRRFEVAAKYLPAFEAFGERPPQPMADERPGAFRKRLFKTLQRRLPEGHEWSGVRADDLADPAARTEIERLVISAATAEGLKPSVSNLPEGREITRNRVDPETGARATEFYSRSSFIKDLGRPGRRVVRLLDPRSRTVIWGEPLERFG